MIGLLYNQHMNEGQQFVGLGNYTPPIVNQQVPQTPLAGVTQSEPSGDQQKWNSVLKFLAEIINRLDRIEMKITRMQAQRGPETNTPPVTPTDPSIK